MVIGVLREQPPEHRVALLPEAISQIISLKTDVIVESGAGENAFFSDPLLGSPILPDYISADYRLDEMSDATLGLTFGKTISGDSDFRARLGYLYQEFQFYLLNFLYGMTA